MRLPQQPEQKIPEEDAEVGKKLCDQNLFFPCKSCVPGISAISAWADKMKEGGEGEDGEIGEDAAAAAVVVVAAAVIVVARRGIRGGDGE